ncbi:peptidylprolyl isomerase [Nocardiopsis sp. NPDC049922]|uniref:peptidylprolyl isomerase n=1 Tax=Nocardiopsis sp. NPDC049922 TaxID=3155157 RepID=UPI003405D9D6
MKRSTLSATALLASTVLLATTACQSDTGQASAQETAREAAADAETTSSPEASGGPADIDVSDVEGAVLSTSEGDIEVDLFPEDAPLTVANFVGLAEGEGVPNPVTGAAAYYDGTVFHRVIEGFMIQGGDPEGTGRGGPGYTFEDEFGSGRTFAEPGVLAMANSGPGTNGSQFFITVAPTEHLDDRHTIFGQVADEESYEVVEAISQVATDQGDRPTEDVTLESVTIRRSGD